MSHVDVIDAELLDLAVMRRRAAPRPASVLMLERDDGTIEISMDGLGAIDSG